MLTQEEKYNQAKKAAKEKMGFLRHLIIYVCAIGGFAIINNLSDPGGYQWWLWPAFGWGIGTVSHFLSVYLFKSGSLEKRLIQQEMEKMDDEK